MVAQITDFRSRHYGRKGEIVTLVEDSHVGVDLDGETWLFDWSHVIFLDSENE